VTSRAVTRAGSRVSVRRSVAVVLAALVLSSCAAAPECDRISGVRPGVCPLPVADRQPAPDVTLPVLQSDAATAEGVRELSLADLQGRVVIVNFWASWCGPCRIEQPDLNAVHALLPDAEVVLIGVNVEDTEANALAHLAEFDVPYLSLFDPVNELAGRFSGIGARTIPTTLILDTEGRVAARLLGLTETREIAALAGAVAGAAG
jgi:thiol-disulfide isomerase/thioredoxin